MSRMIIVAGALTVAAENRDSYLEGCRTVIRAARAEPGCLDFSLSADPVDPSRINVYERWDSVESVERFRQAGPSDDQQAMIVGAEVAQYEIASATSLT